MNGFTSLSQMANSVVNKAKSQQRIIAREIATDGPTPWKLEKLAKTEEQITKASDYFTQSMEQDEKNAKTFMDSVTETLDKINEEVKKKEEEEKAAEKTEKTSPDNAAEDSQNTDENAEPGTIVDIVIPSTVVSTDNLTNKTDNTKKDDSTVNVSV